MFCREFDLPQKFDNYKVELTTFLRKRRAPNLSDSMLTA